MLHRKSRQSPDHGPGGDPLTENDVPYREAVAPGEGTPSGGDAVSAAGSRQRLGELLVARGVLTPTQLAEALLQQPHSGKRLGTLLVELGMLDERAVAAAVAQQAGLPVLDLRVELPDANALDLLPEALARSLVAIPMRLRGRQLEVAVADPLNPAVIAQITSAAGDASVTLVVAAPSDIRRAIDSSYRALTGVDHLVDAFQVTAASEPVEDARVAEDAPVVQLLNRIVTQAVRDRASDVHIEPHAERVRIRFRIDGALHDVLSLPQSMAPALVSRLKIMAEMNIVERRRPQDGQVAIDVDGRTVDVRIATGPTIWGEKAALRLLDRTRTLHHLDGLGMSPVTHARFTKVLRAPYGMVICVGPTGSGKTTTLYATLNEINNSERNVMTIEDPVEYIFPGITQFQVNEQSGLGFASGLRSLLRQDPDIILVGEIRDPETARVAVEAALTGHFVLSSLHATDAASALQRFVDMGIEPFLIASTVTAVLGQRLVRRICDQCRTEYRPSVEELAFYEEAGGRLKLPDDPAGGGSSPPEFTHGRGCNFCARTGYQDRVGVFEMLRLTDELKRRLVTGAPVEALRAAAREDEMETLLEAGLAMVDHDITTVGEVMRSVYVL